LGRVWLVPRDRVARYNRGGSRAQATSSLTCMIQLKDGLCGKVDLRHIAELLNETQEE
jgi:hypothetical protein